MFLQSPFSQHRRLAVVYLLAFLALAGNAGAEQFTGSVVAVLDGDTVTVLTGDKRQVRVRLAEVDAPENKQAHGMDSKQSLSDLAFGQAVRVEVVTVDRYGRTVGRIYAGAVDVNAEQVKRGWAWVYRQYSKDPSLLMLEADARAAMRGLWADANPTAPWDFRHGTKALPPTSDSSDYLGRDKAGTPATVSVRCGTKKYCKQMASCEEAKFFLTSCNMRSLDSDGDGIPCEAICGSR